MVLLFYQALALLFLLSRHANMGYYWNALGMSSMTNRLLVYKWETDTPYISPDSSSLVAHGQVGQWLYIDSFHIRVDYLAHDGKSIGITVGSNAYWWSHPQPAKTIASSGSAIIENLPQYYVWQGNQNR